MAAYRSAEPEGLGPLRETFAGPTGVAGYFYAGVMLVVGVGLLVRFPKEGAAWWLAGFCLLLAVFLAWLTRRNSRHRVFVHARGLRVVRGATTREMLWTEV